VSARGGESNPVNERARARTKIIFAKVGIDWGREYQAGKPAGQRVGRMKFAKRRSLFRC
jgi:hypothetical protein